MSLQSLVQTAAGGAPAKSATPATKSSGLSKLVASAAPIQPTAPILPEKPQSLGSKIYGGIKATTDFLGLGGATDVIGTHIARATVPESQKQYIPAPTAGQNLGAALSIGSFLIPATGAEKIGAALAEGALKKVALSGAAAGLQYGALGGAGQALSDPNATDKSIGLETLKGGALGAAGGAALGLGGVAAGKGLAKLLAKAKPAEDIHIPDVPSELPPGTSPTTAPAKTPQSLYEPYTPTEQLPTIQMGAKAKNELPTIQTLPNKEAPVVETPPVIQKELPRVTKTKSTPQENGVPSNPFPARKLVTEPTSKGPELTFHPVETPQVPKTAPTKTIPTKTDKVPFTATNTSIAPKQTGKTITKAASDINQTLVKQGFDALPEAEQAKYTAQSYKDAAQQTASLMDKDIEKAKAMATGKEPVAKGLNAQILFNAIEAHATQEGDGELLQQLAKSPHATRLSEAGQTLGGHGYNDNPNSVVKAIKDVQTARETNAAGKGNDIAKVKKETVKQGTEEIKKAAPTKSDWAAFVTSIECRYG